jgi:hypothetical protein
MPKANIRNMLTNDKFEIAYTIPDKQYCVIKIYCTTDYPRNKMLVISCSNFIVMWILSLVPIIDLLNYDKNKYVSVVFNA